MKRTKIDYLTHTWNPLAMRCDPVSPGCSHCWHLDMTERMIRNPILSKEKRVAYSGDGIVTDYDEMLTPSAKKKPAIVGVQFMGDLFHDKIPAVVIDQMIDEMIRSQQHKFLILTKRPERMKSIIENRTMLSSNIWLGVSIEDQQTADQRISELIKTPAVNRFISAEPLLGPIEFHANLAGIDWVIAGGESGPYARPMGYEWIWDIINQCEGAGVPAYFKQWGEWIPEIEYYRLSNHKPGQIIRTKKIGDETFHRIGKVKAGHAICGEEIRELPEGLKI